MKYLNFCTKIKCVNIKQAYLVIIFQECHNFAIKRNLAMELQTIHTIINLLCTSGFITTFLYYGSRKRKEAALASQEENKAISSYADEWKELYERSNGMVVNLNGKVDSLYEEINGYRSQIRKLKDEKNNLTLLVHELKWNRCIVDGCKNRTPPRKRKNMEKMVEIDESNVYKDREDGEDD